MERAVDDLPTREEQIAVITDVRDAARTLRTGGPARTPSGGKEESSDPKVRRAERRAKSQAEVDTGHKVFELLKRAETLRELFVRHGVVF
jgi:hypothetical protein